ncbi:hypothetical protein D3C85_964530 [compost metagenome]
MTIQPLLSPEWPRVDHRCFPHRGVARPGALKGRTFCWKLRSEFDLLAKGGMYGHDHFSCTHFTAVSPESHDLLVPAFNLADRTGEPDLVAKLFCHLGAQNLRATNNAGLLRAVLH